VTDHPWPPLLLRQLLLRLVMLATVDAAAVAVTFKFKVVA
jgi:hypothetical protein